MSYYNNGGSGTNAGGGNVTVESGTVEATFDPSATLHVTQSGVWTITLLSGSTTAATQSGTWTVSLAANQDVNALPAAAVSGGATAFAVISLATTNATIVKNAHGNLYGFTLANTNATDWRYLKLFNKATLPVPGTDTPVAVIALPPNASTSRDMPVGVSFSAGVSFAITANPALNDTTAIAANEVVGTLEFA